jgi:hypothetical protein
MHFVLWMALAIDPGAFTGVITDMHCAASHMKGHSEPDCVKMCVKGSSEYALFDGKSAIRLEDQKSPAKFAGQRVRITGVYNEKKKSIRVEAIEAEQND